MYLERMRQSCLIIQVGKQILYCTVYYNLLYFTVLYCTVYYNILYCSGETATCCICKTFYNDIVDAVFHVHAVHEILGGSQIVMLGRFIIILYRTILTTYVHLRRRQIVEGRVPGALRGQAVEDMVEEREEIVQSNIKRENDSIVEPRKDTDVVIELPRQVAV